MTLDKAIEVLADLLGEGPYYDPDHRREAVRLGMEALKKVYRDRQLWRVPPLLPGETKEGEHGKTGHD